MSKDNYIKESDLFNAMENNSHMVEVFGTKRKMIDGMLLTYNIAEFERLNIEEIRNKAITEFAEQLKNKIQSKYCREDLTKQYVGMQTCEWIDEIAEQMKAGAK